MTLCMYVYVHDYPLLKKLPIPSCLPLVALDCVFDDLLVGFPPDELDDVPVPDDFRLLFDLFAVVITLDTSISASSSSSL